MIAPSGSPKGLIAEPLSSPYPPAAKASRNGGSRQITAASLDILPEA